MSDRLVIEAEPRKEIKLSLVGKEYIVKPPKGALGVKIAQTAREAKGDALKSWEVLSEYIRLAFGPKQAAAVQKRLDDPKDDLDIAHIMELIRRLTETVTGDPTT